MPNETPSTQSSEAPAVAEKPIAPGQNNDLLREAVAKTQAAVTAELAGLDIEGNREKLMEGRHQDDEPVAGKPRSSDGKFKPKEAREQAIAATEKPAAEGDGEKPAKPTAAVLKHLQDLVANGRPDEAAKMIGLDLDKGPRAVEFAKLREQRNKQLELVDRRKAEAAQAYQHVERIATNLEQQFGRFRAAEAAYKSGDFDAAHRLAFGESVDDYNRKALSQMATRDPRVAQLEARLAAQDRQRQVEQQQWQTHQQQAAVEQERSQWVANLGTELKELEDPRVSKAMKKGDFVERVFKEQAKAYDAHSDSTISAEEAAELALQEIELEYRSLRSVFDEDTDNDEGPRGAQKPASASRGAPTRPVRPAKPTHLRSQEAAEAHVATKPKPGSREMLDMHIRRTLSMNAKDGQRTG